MRSRGNRTPDAKIREDAIRVLEIMLTNDLTQARWDHVAESLDIAIAAEAAGDLDVISQTTIRLELINPAHEFTRIGAEHGMRPPPYVQERADRLIHALRSALPKYEAVGAKEER